MMYQVKILQANQLEILEELMNMWLKEEKDMAVVDIKFQTISNNGMTEYIGIMIYQH